MPAPAGVRSPATNFFLKTFYVLSFLVVLHFRLPYWIYQHLRQERTKKWNWRKLLFISIFKHVASYLAYDMGLGMGKTGRDPTADVADDESGDAKHIFVQPFPMELIKGEIREYVLRAEVTPERIGGYWFGRRGPKGKAVPPPKEDEKLVMHCHGGGYVMGTAHPEDVTAAISRGILDYCGPIITRTFSIDYRLCSAPPYPQESPFPAALIDALAGYKYLLDFGFKPENIIVMGDSAGGNLGLALTRYLVENPIESLPPPGALLLLSPWSDITCTHEGTHPDCSAMKNNFSDYLLSPNVELGQWSVKAFLGPMGVEEAKRNPYISPASLHLTPDRLNGLFKGFPRAYIVAGGAERILDEIRCLTERYVRDVGEQGKPHPEAEEGSYLPWVVYDEVEEAVHDFLMFPWHQPEVNETLFRINRWVQDLDKFGTHIPGTEAKGHRKPIEAPIAGPSSEKRVAALDTIAEEEGEPEEERDWLTGFVVDTWNSVQEVVTVEA